MSQKKMKRMRKIEMLGHEVVEKRYTPGMREILKQNWKFIGLLLIGVIGLYFNSLWGGFVSDDYASITQNPEIKALTPALKSVGAMTAVTNSLLAIIFGVESSIPFHVFNLILYLLILVVAFIFIILLTDSKLVARVTVIVFAVLPVHVESISWISGRPYLFVALFVLTMLDLMILFINRREKKYLWLILILLPILFKTDRIRGFAFVILAVLYLLTFGNKLKYRIQWGKLFLGVVVLTFFLGLFSWPIIRTRVFDVNSGVNVSDSIFYNPFFQYPTAIPKYLQLVFFPIDLTLYHTMYVAPIWINWVIFFLYLFLLGWFWFKDKKYFFALAFVFAASAPSMAPVKVSWLVAERYVFLGSLGVALLFGLLFERYWERAKWLVTPLLIVVVMFYSLRVFLRNIDWQTNHNLWVNTCQVSPNSHNAWNNIGDDYDKLGQYENAVKGFGMSFAIKQNYADAYHNQANIFYKMGRIDLARQTYEMALSYNSGLYQTYITLIQLDLMEMDKESLLKHLSQLNQIKPNDLQVAYITATAYARIGMISEAKNISEILYQQFPNISEIKNLYQSLNSFESSSSTSLQKR